jgi:hypothetical protein
MIELIPWPQVVLGAAAALAILVIYDVVYVWPLCRRVAAATQACRALEERLERSREIEERLAAVESMSRSHWSQIGERLGQLELSIDSRSYEQAIGFAELGRHTDELMACFGLTEGEASLVRLLHGDKQSAAESRKADADDPPSTVARLKFG